MSVETMSDEQAKLSLIETARVLQQVIAQMRRALEAVDEQDANAIHAAHIKAQRQRIVQMGVSEKERTILRAHPLFKIWKLMVSAVSLVEDILLVTNPNLNRGRVRSLDAEKAVVKAGKIELDANAA
jgi:hypothetical protein